MGPCPGDLVCSGHLLEDKAGQTPYTQHAVYIGVNQPYLGGPDPLFDDKFRTFLPFFDHFPPFLGSLMPLKVLFWL